MNLIIPLEEFPEEGRYLSGELDAAVFGIDSAALRSTGPLSYELEVQLFETELMVRGSLTAPFELRCDRCLAYFPYTVELDDLAYSYDVKGKLCPLYYVENEDAWAVLKADIMAEKARLAMEETEKS